jgi:hypothetical protein
MQKIGKMSLRNGGGFVARIQFNYLDENGERKLTGQTGEVATGFTMTVDPGELGVPEGATINLFVFAIMSFNCEAQEAFVFEKGNSSTANYFITGSALGNDLKLVDVTVG